MKRLILLLALIALGFLMGLGADMVGEGANENGTIQAQIFTRSTDPQSITIGAGDEEDLYPMDFSVRSSVYEWIYLDNELEFTSGTITSMDIYNSFLQGVFGKATKIYMGSTVRDDLSEGWIPASELTLVFDGLVDYPAGQHTIHFDFPTPYLHTSGNLVIMFNRPYEPYYYTLTTTFKCQTVGNSRARQARSMETNINPSNPTGGYLVNQFPKATLFYHPVPVDNDLSALTISGSDMPRVGEASNYTVRIKNTGTAPQTTYTVKLMAQDDTVLASVPGPTIFGGEFLDLTISWTPTSAGPFTIYGKVEAATDEYSINNRTSTMGVNVQPEGRQSVTIGVGDRRERYPMDFISKTSLYECIYLADELGFTSGTIHSMALYNKFRNNIPGAATKIYLGNTDQIDLSADWISASELTLVYDGVIDYPSGSNTVYIDFQTPYLHTPGNLVMMFYRPTDTTYYLGSDYFKCQRVSAERARYHRSSTGTIDQYYPHSGSLVDEVPQATFLFNPCVIENDLRAKTLSGADFPIVGEASDYTVRIDNIGVEDQHDYSVKIMSSEDVELASVAGPPINSMQSLNVVVPWTPATAGPTTIYAKVEMVGDELDFNNRTKAIPVDIRTAEAQIVTIGAGDELALYPMYFYYRNSIYECIYLADELSFSGGVISSVALYNRFVTSIGNGATKIYLGSTEQSDLSSGWIPANELTLVYNGDVEYPIGNNAVKIGLQTPYYHAGGNLVVMFHRPWDSNYYSHLNYFKCQATYQGRARSAVSDLNHLDPNNPPEGYLVETFPQTVFFFNTDNDLSALTLTGNSAASVGEVSDYTVRVKNYGVVAHFDYTVKLMGPGDEVLASVTGIPLSSLQIVDVVIPWTPTTAGPTTIYGKVEAVGDQVPSNDCTPGFELVVHPPRVTDVTATLINAGNTVKVAWSLPDAEPREKGAAFEGKALATPSPDMTKVSENSASQFKRGTVKAVSNFAVYRLLAGQEQIKTAWEVVGTLAPDIRNVYDNDWPEFSDGDYRWAVEVLYSDGTSSLPSFSNILSKNANTGVILGTVRKEDHSAITGATISCGTEATTSDAEGAYSLFLPVGSYTVTVSAPGYLSQTVQDVVVGSGTVFTINFVLEPGNAADDPQIPVVATALNGNYPNPFNPETTIRYSVKEPGRVKLEVYNIRGQLVRTLIDEDHATGHYTQVFNAKDNSGRSISSGVYLIRMLAPGYQKVSKMILMQ